MMKVVSRQLVAVEENNRETPLLALLASPDGAG